MFCYLSVSMSVRPSVRLFLFPFLNMWYHHPKKNGRTTASSSCSVGLIIVRYYVSITWLHFYTNVFLCGWWWSREKKYRIRKIMNSVLFMTWSYINLYNSSQKQKKKKQQKLKVKCLFYGVVILWTSYCLSIPKRESERVCIWGLYIYIIIYIPSVFPSCRLYVSVSLYNTLLQNFNILLLTQTHKHTHAMFA